MGNGHDPATDAQSCHGRGGSGANGQYTGLDRAIDVASLGPNVTTCDGSRMPRLILKVPGEGPCPFVIVAAHHHVAV